MNQKIDNILSLYGINKSNFYNKEIDNACSYEFLSRLLTPFNEWPSYKLGVIDENGNIIISNKRMNSIQRKSFTKLDLIVLRMKKMLEKTSYGSILNKIPTQTLASMILKETEIPVTNTSGIENKDIPLSFARRMELKRKKKKELIQ